MKYSFESKQEYFRRLKKGGYEYKYERVISFLMNNNYAQKVDIVSKALNIPKNTLLHVHVKKCEYLIYDKKYKLISLDRKGKSLKDIGVDLDFPEDNESVLNFVICQLVKSGMNNEGKFGLTFKESIPLVRQFCQEKDIPFGRYDIDQNTVYEQAKKLARKFRWE